MSSFIKSHPLLKIVNSSLIELPSPAGLSSMWNYGSLLGLCLLTQLLTGIFLAIHYSSDVGVAFNAVDHVMRDVSLGWPIRMAHANGASLFFICLYLHASRGIYYGSFKLREVWLVGVVILLLVMATAFMGYVLPWGQMSFWGATVITNLFSAIPGIGGDIVTGLWGGFAVDNPTLTRFFAFHFLLPFVIAAMVGVHLVFLHQTGSSNPLGLSMNKLKIMFHPYFSLKDLMGGMLMLFIFTLIVLGHPWDLGDPENFIPANSLVTPVHIQPEWYFLFAYAILRSIPNKLGGVLALAGSILILAVLSAYPSTQFRGILFYPVGKMFFWVLIVCVILLTWIGAQPVEEPYIITGQVLTILYFSFYGMFVPSLLAWDRILA